MQKFFLWGISLMITTHILATDIYVAGVANNRATVWKVQASTGKDSISLYNPQYLWSDSLTNPESSANGITSIGNATLFVAGSTGSGPNLRACFWQSDVSPSQSSPLPNILEKTNVSEAKSATFFYNKLYIAGYINDKNNKAVVWIPYIKDSYDKGVIDLVSDSDLNPSQAFFAISKGNNLYITGQYDSKVALWIVDVQNNVSTILPPKDFPVSLGHSIAFQGDTIYVAGTINDSMAFWTVDLKNKNFTPIYKETSQSEGYSIVSQNSNLYIAGDAHTQALWYYDKKYNTYEFIEDFDYPPLSYGAATSLGMLGSHLMVAGYDTLDNTNFSAKLWGIKPSKLSFNYKPPISITLPLPKNYSSAQAFCICIPPSSLTTASKFKNPTSFQIGIR